MYEKIELDSLVIEITRKCNLNCKHCFNSGSRIREMPLELLDCIIQEAMTFGVKEISLSGGEPLLHSQLFNIFDMLKKYPQIKFGLLTNGTLLNCKIIHSIEALENSFIQISFDGSQKEIYEANRGEGTFEKFWSGLEMLALSKLRIRGQEQRFPY